MTGFSPELQLQAFPAKICDLNACGCIKTYIYFLVLHEDVISVVLKVTITANTRIYVLTLITFNNNKYLSN